jgi:hypothetical protein
MRKVICYEGRWDMDHFIEPGALKFPEEEGSKLPITQQWEWDGQILGWAEDFERDVETGRVTANLDIISDEARTLLENKDVGATIYANQLVMRRSGDGKRHVYDATVRAIFLSVDLPWVKEDVDG